MSISKERLAELIEAADGSDITQTPGEYGRSEYRDVLTALRELAALREGAGRWVPVTERLPAFNTLIVAQLSGRKFHSGVNWAREGVAFMVRHNDPAAIDGIWSIGYHRNALEFIDATEASVVAWRDIPPFSPGAAHE